MNESIINRDKLTLTYKEYLTTVPSQLRYRWVVYRDGMELRQITDGWLRSEMWVFVPEICFSS